MRGLRIEPAWLLPEKRRGYLAVGFCVLVTVPALLLTRGDLDDLAATTLTRALVVLVSYLLAYVVLTAWALARTPWRELATWAESSREGSLRGRFVDLTEPGAGLALYASALALLGTIVLSRDHSSAGERAWLVVALCIALIVLAWVTALLTFTVDYLAKDGRRGWRELTFPGDEERRVGDYLYFATSVSTTFGATDVVVPSRRLRRDVTTHAIVAFVFNTVIIVVTLSLVTSGVR